MQPEYPADFDRRKWIPIQTENPIPCSMLRLETPCGNDTQHAYLSADGRSTGQYAVLAICAWCQRELRSTGAETTDYWREQQVAWGVR